MPAEPEEVRRKSPDDAHRHGAQEGGGQVLERSAELIRVARLAIIRSKESVSRSKALRARSWAVIHGTDSSMASQAGRMAGSMADGRRARPLREEKAQPPRSAEESD
jgi:hypothetical protein